MTTTSRRLPVFRRVAEELIDRIESGELKVGRPAPTVKEVATDHQVGLDSARRALIYLEDHRWAMAGPGSLPRLIHHPDLPAPASAHQRIVDDLVSQMTSGELEPGQRVPPERALAQRYGESRRTVAQALEVLEKAGWVSPPHFKKGRSAKARPRVQDPEAAKDVAPRAPWGTYQRIAQDLIAQIESKELRTGERLPGEEALADHYGVGRGTIRKALDRVEKRGLIAFRQGVGRIVADPQEPELMEPRRQIIEELTAQISAGALKAGEQVPSERVLALHYRTSRGVAREALAELRENGLLGTGSRYRRVLSAEEAYAAGPARSPFRRAA